MKTVTLELPDEDVEFVDEHDIDLSAVMDTALDRERRRVERENPDPTVPKQTVDHIRALHYRIVEERKYGLGSFQQSAGDRVALAMRGTDAGYRLKLSVGEIETLPETDIGKTLAESGPYLAAVGSQLSAILAALNNADPDEFVFACTDHDDPDPEWELGVEKATFEMHVSVNS